MIKTIYLLLCCYSLAQAQNVRVNIKYDEKLDHSFFQSSDSIYNPLTLVFTDENGKIHYDNVPDSNKYATQTNLILNKDPYRQMRFAEAYKKGDTLEIEIHEGNPSESVHLKLTNSSSGWYAGFWSSTPQLGEADVKLNSIELILRDRSPGKGDLLRGKVTFKAICSKDCGYETYEGEGYFKCIVQ